MMALEFHIRLVEPVLARSLAGDPNSGISFDYIPGSMIRGALISRYLRGRPGLDLAADPTGRCLFFDGSTRYLNAYPLDRGNRRTFPVPASWFLEKGETSPVHDYSVEDHEELKFPKAPPDPFCRLVSGNGQPFVELYTPARQINVHTWRSRQKGRATATEGTVFRYDALAAGEAFGGVILVEEEKEAGTLEALLQAGDWLLGRSHEAGYGRIQVEGVRRTNNWREAGTELQDIRAGERFTLTLLSDTLIRDTNGQYQGDLDDTALARALGLRSLKRFQTFKRTSIVGGFNRKWGLPLPQTLALAAGSVLVYQTTDPIPAGTIAGLEAAGLGERRAEGFGRVVVNWHTEAELVVIEPPERPRAAVSASLSPGSAQVARQMAERLLRRQLDQRLVEYINPTRIDRPPTNSQLSRFRAIARSALAEGDVARLSVYLNDIADRKSARTQFEKGRVERPGAGRMPLLDWLRQRVVPSDPNDIWTQLGQTDLPTVGGVPAQLTLELTREYTVRLIDGLLAKIARERREGGPDG